MIFNIRNYLPEKKILILIVILSLVGPFNYAINYFFPPQGTVFVGYTDDVYMLTLMKSWGANFNDPWGFHQYKIWENPLIGSTYLFLLLGIIPFLLKIDVYAAFIFFKFLFALIYYIIVYNLIAVFVKEKSHRNLAFVLFGLSAGIGGIIYIVARFLFGPSQYLPIIGYAFTREFDELGAVAHSLTHTFRLYYVIPETLGYLSLLLMVKDRKILSGISLGLAFLFYPMHGLAFSIVLLLYSAVKNYDKISVMVRKIFSELLPVYSAAAPFLLAWILPYFFAHDRSYFEATKLAFEGLPTINIVISFFFGLCLITYYFYKRRPHVFPNSLLLILSGVIAVIFSFENMYTLTLTSGLFREWSSKTGLLKFIEFFAQHSLIIEVAMIALSLILILALVKSKTDQKIKFLGSWIILFIVLSGLSPSNFGYIVNPVRFAPSLIFPITLLAFYGLLEFARNFKIKPLFILSVVILLSLPSLAGYNYWVQKSARSSDAFYAQDEYNALFFLENQPDGVVFSSTRYGPYIPYYSGKYAFIFSGRTQPKGSLLANVNRDEYNFYRNQSTTAAMRKEILSAYNITYVIVGPKDKGIELPSILSKIRSGETEVYARY